MQSESRLSIFISGRVEEVYKKGLILNISKVGAAVYLPIKCKNVYFKKGDLLYGFYKLMGNYLELLNGYIIDNGVPFSYVSMSGILKSETEVLVDDDVYSFKPHNDHQARIGKKISLIGYIDCLKNPTKQYAPYIISTAIEGE